jgi:hypothetical protein
MKSRAEKGMSSLTIKIIILKNLSESKTSRFFKIYFFIIECNGASVKRRQNLLQIGDFLEYFFYFLKLFCIQFSKNEEFKQKMKKLKKVG